MSEQELINENKILKEKIAFLEKIVNRGSSGNTSAYNAIRLMIIEKVEKEVPFDIISGQQKKWTRERAERKAMSDLKWDLRVRNISDFRSEHIEPAKQYLKDYKIDDIYKKGIVDNT